MTRTILFVGCALVLLAFLAGRRSADQSATVAQLRARVDSLSISRPQFDRFQQRVDTVTVHARLSALAYMRLADSLKAVADTAGKAPRSPVAPSDTLEATGLHSPEAVALRGALTAQEQATAALTVALDTMTAARDSAVARADRAEVAARQGLTVATHASTVNLGLLRIPRPPKWVTAVVGCAAGGYLDRAEPIRGCGLAGLGLTLVVPTR